MCPKRTEINYTFYTCLFNGLFIIATNSEIMSQQVELMIKVVCWWHHCIHCIRTCKSSQQKISIFQFANCCPGTYSFNVFLFFFFTADNCNRMPLLYQGFS